MIAIDQKTKLPRFTGTFNTHVEPNGRVNIPAAFRPAGPKTRCSFTLFSGNDASAIGAYLSEYPPFKAKVLRELSPNSIQVETESGNGRIILPEEFRQKASLLPLQGSTAVDVILYGCETHFKIVSIFQWKEEEAARVLGQAERAASGILMDRDL